MNVGEGYLIHWTDHFYKEGWLPLSGEGSVGEVVTVSTVGFLVAEDDVYYHLAQSITDDMCMHIMSILKQNVERVMQI